MARDFSQFAAKNCFQLNDTHPTIAVAGADAPADG